LYYNFSSKPYFSKPYFSRFLDDFRPEFFTFNENKPFNWLKTLKGKGYRVYLFSTGKGHFYYINRFTGFIYISSIAFIALRKRSFFVAFVAF